MQHDASAALSPHTEAVVSEHDLLVARVADLERAYAGALERLHRYERERGEVRHRLERLLDRLGPGEA